MNENHVEIKFYTSVSFVLYRFGFIDRTQGMEHNIDFEGQIGRAHV